MPKKSELALFLFSLVLVDEQKCAFLFAAHLVQRSSADPILYGANMTHTRTYGATRADRPFELHTATRVLPSVIGRGRAKISSSQTDNCSSCPEAMQVSGAGRCA